MSKPATTAAEPAAQLPAVVDAPPARGLTLDLSAQDLLRQRSAVKQIVKEVLEEGTHYGASYPGDERKNLLQPGADALIVAFGLSPRFEIKREDISVAGEGMHREYTVTCTLFSRGGIELGSGPGSCSTLESKYRWRFAKPVCPSCGKETVARSKPEYGGGWYCNPRKDGCGSKWPKGAREIEGQERGKVPNADIADTYNTILKIACKRAKVAAVILITGCSDMFTQDLEDQEDGKEHEERGDESAPKQDAEQLRREMSTPPGRAAGAPPPAAKGAPPAAGQQPPAAPPAPAADDQVKAQLAEAYAALGKSAGAGPAKKIWNRWGKDDAQSRADRLAAMRGATAHIAAIRQRLGDQKADQLLTDLLVDRGDPDDVDGMLADLAKAAGPAPATPATARPAPPADDEPPF